MRWNLFWRSITWIFFWEIQQLEPVCCKKQQKKVPDQLLVCAHWWVYYILTIYAHQACPLHKRCIALHCNDSYFHSKWPFFQTWPNWLKKVNLFSFQSKWSGLKKMVILNENSCHCNSMQCIFNEGDKLGADRPLPITVWNCSLEYNFKTTMTPLWLY